MIIYIIILLIISVIISIGIIKLVEWYIDIDKIYINKRKEKYLYYCDLATDDYIRNNEISNCDLKDKSREIIGTIVKDVLSKIKTEKGFDKRKNIIKCQLENTVYTILRKKGYCFIYIGCRMEGHISSYIEREDE